MSILGLFRSCNDTSADSPDRLICNHNLAPISDLPSNGSKLSGIDSVSLASFTFVELLANAGKNA